MYTIILERVDARTANLKVASGNITFGFPQPRGFTATVTKLSGQFNSDFATTQSSGGHYQFGDGSARYQFEMAGEIINLRRT